MLTPCMNGQGFYDPVADKLIEPDLAGISYSFTADGFYEEAYYRSIPNRMFVYSNWLLRYSFVTAVTVPVPLPPRSPYKVVSILTKWRRSNDSPMPLLRNAVAARHVRDIG
jgi:hypothetical protein